VRSVVSDPAGLVDASVRAYAKSHRDYDRRHDEIFNSVEQGRLRRALEAALAAVEGGPPRRALDLGCGTGNVTTHLLDLGLEVVAADVSPDFVGVVERRFAGRPVRTLRIGGLDLHELEDRTFDVVAAYSVLHHVPDYLRMVRELHRTTRPGGVIHLDHEHLERHWTPDPELSAFREALDERRHPGWWHPTRKRWQRYLVPSNYVFAVRERLRPGFWMDEGDIHAWPDYHLEWARIEAALAKEGADVVRREEYLLFRPEYPADLYDRFRERCSDMQALTARRTLP
jgi:SAM-dependent methyltransferase